MEKLTITVKTLFGLENVLREEIEELGYNEVELLNRAVQIKGTWEDVYRLNYRCRLAISVLVQIKEFKIHTEDDLYPQAKKIDWTSYFDGDKTFAVKGAVFSTFFKHSQYPMLLVKDAIADVFREKTGERPNVNTKAPQVMFDVYIKDKTVTVSLNTSGLPLFQRGYRQETGEAPMNEVLAAGLLRLSGWDRKSTLIDPMTGSGTIAIEAALWAADIPAMIERNHFAFKNFKSYQEETWEKVRNEGNNRPVNLGFDILAYDIDAEMIQKARRNSRMAPIGNMVKFELSDALTLTPPEGGGTLICNPPYEERMGENTEDLYEKLGDVFKNNFKGYNCWVVSSNMDSFKHLGLRPDTKIKVFNGNLECSFREYKIFEGTRKEHISTLAELEELDAPKEKEILEKEENYSDKPYKRDFTKDKPRRDDKFGEKSFNRDGDRDRRTPRRDDNRGDRTFNRDEDRRTPRRDGKYGDKPFNRDEDRRTPRRDGKYGDKPFNRDEDRRTPRRDGKYGDKPFNRDEDRRTPRRDGKYGDKPFNRDEDRRTPRRDGKYGDKSQKNDFSKKDNYESRKEHSDDFQKREEKPMKSSGKYGRQKTNEDASSKYSLKDKINQIKGNR